MTYVVTTLRMVSSSGGSWGYDFEQMTAFVVIKDSHSTRSSVVI
jgi:hypothetical protein